MKYNEDINFREIEIKIIVITISLQKIIILTNTVELLADTICSDWENHGQTFKEKPLFSGQLITDYHYNRHVFPRLWSKINLSIANISEFV